MTTRLTIRLDFEPGCRLGPGKVALLQGIREHGSIAAAGRALGMSYRRAWLLIAELNGMFAEPLVLSKPGGKAGGGARLTDMGDAVLDRYRAIEKRLARNAAAEVSAIETMLKQP